MSCRDLTKVHPELAHRVRLVLRNWECAHPGQPRCIVTCGRRTTDEQARLYAQGRGIPGKIVTHAPAGTSLHEYGLAVDLGFVDEVAGCMDYAEWRFHELGKLIRAVGLEWGGEWARPDLPHAQAPGVSWRDAHAGREPEFPALPVEVA